MCKRIEYEELHCFLNTPNQLVAGDVHKVLVILHDYIHHVSQKLYCPTICHMNAAAT